MSRRSYIWRDGDWREYDPKAIRPRPIAPMIIRDTEPYRSVVTGEIIGGRRQHREHLRAHGCIEVGNEMPVPRPEPLPPVREDIAASLQASPERIAEARAATERAMAAVVE